MSESSPLPPSPPPTPSSVDDLLDMPEAPPNPLNWIPGQSALPLPFEEPASASLNERPTEVPVAIFNLEENHLGFLAMGFSARELLERLIRHARDPDPKISLPALKELRKHAKEVAQLNGRITQSTIKAKGKNRDGQELSGSIQTRTLSLGPPAASAPSPGSISLQPRTFGS